MKDLREYGVAVMTLSDVVDDFCLAQGNLKQSMILAQYRHARWAWKDLFRTTLWNIRKQVICVDCHTHTIRLPKDCERLISISVVDCYGKIQPLGFNPHFNTAQIRCSKISCSCGKCGGQNTLCAAIDSIKVVTETVVINDTDYTKTIYTRYDGAGNVQKQMIIPAWDVAQGKVVYNTITETICSVETTTNGCIKNTPANIGLLRNNCGCGSFIDEWGALGYGWDGMSAFRELMPSSYNYWGEWNFNAADPNIVHIFSAGYVTHFGHNEEQENEWRRNISQVIVDYQTNGETPNEEILIPEYAVEAIEIGIVYRQKYLNPKAPEGDKLGAKYAWQAAKMNVAKYLNPIVMDDIRKLQSNPRYW